VILAAHNSPGTSLSSPSFFKAGVPTVYTYYAQSTGAATESVQGSVNPSGQATTY
jgi:hypothetical protein